jgi:hypothetical protein
MERAKVWFRCAAMHDPVSPVIVRPAKIGWHGRNREIDLTIDREFTGEELVLRMKGWITIDPAQAVDLFSRYGRLKVFETGTLVVEVEEMEDLEKLGEEVHALFGDQCDLEPIPKNKP